MRKTNYVKEISENAGLDLIFPTKNEKLSTDQNLLEKQLLNGTWGKIVWSSAVFKNEVSLKL